MLKIFYYSVLIALTLNQFVALSKSSGLNIYIFDLLIALFVLVGIFTIILKKNHFYIPKYLVLFLIFFMWAFVCNILKSHQYGMEVNLVANSYLLRFLIYLLCGVVVFNMLLQKSISVDTLFKSIIASGVVLTILGYMQLLLLPDFSVLNPIYGWDPHKNRLASTFFDPNFLGAYLNICLLLFVERYLKDIKVKKILILVPLILLSGIILTFSRSSWLMSATIILVYGLLKNRWLLLIAVCIMFSAYFFVPRIQTRLVGITDPSDSAHFRVISWRNTYDIAKDNLGFGVGFNYFRYAQVDYGYIGYDNLGGNSGAGADSSLLFVLATTGVIGFVLFLCAFLLPLTSPNTLSMALILGILVQSQFINLIFYPQIMFLWIILFCISSYSFFRT